MIRYGIYPSDTCLSVKRLSLSVRSLFWLNIYGGYVCQTLVDLRVFVIHVSVSVRGTSVYIRLCMSLTTVSTLTAQVLGVSGRPPVPL